GVRGDGRGGDANREDQAHRARRGAGEGRAGPERGGGAVDGDRDNEGRELMDSALRIGRSASRTALEGLLILAIFLGSLAMWIGLPLGWLWLVTRVVKGNPEAYAAALFGCPVTMTLLGILLARLNGYYLRLTGGHPHPYPAP